MDRIQGQIPIPQDIKQIVVTRDVDRYYASIQYEATGETSKGNGTIGMDMGIKNFMTTSDGLQVDPLNSLRRNEKRPKRQQKKLSMKRNGSNKRKREIARIGKIHQHIRDARTDFNHKVSSAIAKHYGAVVIEDLNIQGMQRNHHLAKSISDQGWYQFRQTLEYKLQWRGTELIEIGRFDPPSKMCSGCGNMKHNLKPSDGIYHCNACCLTMDRDLNAAINILNIGLIKIGGSPEFTPVESATAAELSKGGLRVATL